MSQERTNLKDARRQLRRKKRERREIKGELQRETDRAERSAIQKRLRMAEQELFRLEAPIRAAEDGRPADGPLVGALPDFLVIGAAKCGTTFLYHILVRHPLVEPAAAKEMRYLSDYFDLGLEWYRDSFPTPRQKDGRTTITGEATPSYMSHPLAAERAAQVVPEARLVALVRNPVDRAFSHYQMGARRGWEPRTFEEAVGANGASLDGDAVYLSRGVYVDQLSRWSEFFGEEQTLVLKSEDLFGSPQEILYLLLDFLGLPGWEPETWQVQDKGGKYKETMDPVMRRRLEEHFRPHNERLYEFLGRDLGW